MLPSFLSNGGPMLWVILFASAAAITVFVERALHYHRAQINSTEFLNGVRTVLKRDNVVEAISICDATHGPVARLVKTAILNRDHGRERVRESLEEAGLAEVPRLEEKLSLLATIAQLAPMLGLLGSVLGFMKIFDAMGPAGLTANIAKLSPGVSEALICTAAGLAVSIPAHAGYNYLVSRVNDIVLDMEKSATEIVNIVSEEPPEKMKFPRNARIARSHLDAAPFAGVLFCLLIFLLLCSLVYTPGVTINLPVSVSQLPGVDGPALAVALDPNGQLYFQNRPIEAPELKKRLQEEVARQTEPVTLVVQADKAVTLEQLNNLRDLAASAGIKQLSQQVLPRIFDASPESKAP